MTNTGSKLAPPATRTTWFAGASGLNMKGVTFNNVQGDMHVNNANRTTKNMNSNNKTKEVTKNITHHESRDQHYVYNQNMTASQGGNGAQSNAAGGRWSYVLEAQKGPPAPRRSNIKPPVLAIEAANAMGHASLLEGISSTRRRRDDDLVPVPGIHTGRRQTGPRVSDYAFGDRSLPPRPRHHSRGSGSGSAPKKDAALTDVPRSKATYSIVRGDVNVRGHNEVITNGKPDTGRRNKGNDDRLVDFAGRRGEGWSDDEDDEDSGSDSDSDSSTISSGSEDTESDSEKQEPPKSLEAKSMKNNLPEPALEPSPPMSHLAPTSLGDIRRSASTAAPRAHPENEDRMDVDDQVPSPVNEGPSRPILSGLNDLVAPSGPSPLKEDKLPMPEKKSKGSKFYGKLRSKFRRMEVNSK